MIGSGGYATRFLLPALKESGCRLHTVVSSGGVSAAEAARKFGAEQASSDAAAAIDDDSVNTVVIATRHNTHADLVVQALSAGKHVFVEKPLAINSDQLDELQAAYVKSTTLLMVGYNRRFAPLTVKAKQLLDQVVGPKSFIITVNAGAVPSGHWTRDRAVGGGRIIGEACHFIDLLRFLSGESIAATHATAARTDPDNRTITLNLANGSIGTIHYFTDGDSSFPKERLEVFCAGRVLQLDNFRELKAWGWPGFRALKSRGQDKGQEACVAAFVNAIRGGSTSPIPANELFEVTQATLETAR
jgi:predicted dehydrogenase